MRLVMAQRDGTKCPRVLRDLEQAGEIARIRKNRYVLPDAADLVTGTLSVHEAGYAFLTNEKTRTVRSIYCSGKHWHRHARRSGGGTYHSQCGIFAARKPRAEGRVIRILTRANETIVGTLQQTRISSTS